MATIKSYTSLEQSKKLAEILSIESADGFYDMAEPEKRQVPIVGNPDDYYDMEDWAIPCWSLATLLNILPRYIKFEGSLTFLSIYQTKNLGWVIEYSNNQEDFVEFAIEHLQIVDACYEMIIKLHEQKLI